MTNYHSPPDGSDPDRVPNDALTGAELRRLTERIMGAVQRTGLAKTQPEAGLFDQLRVPAAEDSVALGRVTEVVPASEFHSYFDVRGLLVMVIERIEGSEQAGLSPARASCASIPGFRPPVASELSALVSEPSSLFPECEAPLSRAFGVSLQRSKEPMREQRMVYQRRESSGGHLLLDGPLELYAARRFMRELVQEGLRSLSRDEAMLGQDACSMKVFVAAPRSEQHLDALVLAALAEAGLPIHLGGTGSKATTRHPGNVASRGRVRRPYQVLEFDAMRM